VSPREIGGYRVIRELGRGGMGTVYEALSTLGTTVALKVVSWPETVDPRARWDAIERFQREARATRSLSHPNICQVLDFGADADGLFIVMEFLDGDSVREIIDLAGKIDLERAVQIVCGVGEALSHAHDRGIIHRDIKPANIMVLRSSQVKLTDFGLASVVREGVVTRTGQTMGTLFYMSPEQVRGDRADARSDIFSLGATFYEMVTGTRAFDADSAAGVMNQILTRDPPLAGTLPEPVSRALQRCLRKDPQQRFQSARDMMTYLARREATADRTLVLPEAPAEPAVSSRRRLPRLPRAVRGWRAAALAAVVLLVTTLLLFRSESRPGRRSTAPEVAAREHRAAARFPPSLRPLQPGVVATYLYGGVDCVGDIAVKPDGTVLVTVGGGASVPPGVYVARAGDECDPTDAYTEPGEPFVEPRGIAACADGRVLVADSGASTVWVIPAPGAPPQVLTEVIPAPCDVLVAPDNFRGPDVQPGDFLVCAGTAAGSDAWGLHVVNQRTGAVCRLAGSPELPNGLLQAVFGPDGTLYAVEDDKNTQDGLTIVTISPNGDVEPRLANYRSYSPHPLPPQAAAGPIAVDPTTGQVLFAYGVSVHRLPDDGGGPETYARGELEIVALAHTPDDSCLFVSEAAPGVVAKIAPCAIEGKLLVYGWGQRGLVVDRDADESFVCLVEGRSDNILPGPGPAAGGGDLSPLSDELIYIVFVVETSYPEEEWRQRTQICKTDLSEHKTVNLTETAGIRGLTCYLSWSPDGKRIAFTHCNPVEGVRPCVTRWDLWVMNADGTAARRVARPQQDGQAGLRSQPLFWWSPSGDRVIYNYGLEDQVVSVDLDGTDPRVLPLPSGGISPDGSKIAEERAEPGVVDGEPGMWHQLRLCRADGSNPQILVEHFVKDSDAVEHMRRLGQRDEIDRWVSDVRDWVGPKHVRWSPKGDRLAFLAALPFDPDAGFYKFQVEVWLYELSTGILTRLTDNSSVETGFSWRGPNTYADRRQVTVGNTTVAFAQVISEGVTIVSRDDDPPPRPGGYRFCGYYYDISTTAKYRGPVKLAMRYEDEDVSGRSEEALSVLRYIDSRGEWQDITTSRDTKKKIIYAEVDSL
jgi:hypothetical protein